MVEPSGSEEERGFQVLLEEVEGKVSAYGEQVKSLGEKLDRVAGEFDSRLIALDLKLDAYTRTLMAKVERLENRGRRARP
jgi:hypothetical protein